MSNTDREHTREIQRKSQAKIQAARKAKGLCYACGKCPAQSEGQRCHGCIVSATERGKRREARLKAENLCRLCANPCDNDTTWCSACLAKRRKYDEEKSRKRTAKGVCNYCGKPRDSEKKICQPCRAKMKQHRQARNAYCVKKRLCADCLARRESPAVTPGKVPLCFDCWLTTIAKRAIGDKNRVDELKTLWEKQGSRCVYTGVVLVPGENASLDHKTPTSRGGGNEVENLQWVDYSVNTMKYNRTHKEFVKWCADIAIKYGAVLPLS